ncbi:hypothetical protein [Empedobacter tilapiae]|uniref:Uncharacterized protein n=1 Tax=Empedobacter tilapiae TaxID=2491114 RepID=A0A4Z1BBZ4_9FLAO|nr:hypothetical protein [Empedobacter tilapiae]TGN26074.1 hypothetical protein E4J94_12015 [Empedobacter tilapiae]
METNKEILDQFGIKIIDNCLDGLLNHFESIRKKENVPLVFKTKKEFLNHLDKDEYELFRKMLIDSVGMVLFEFFNLFEEDERFKLIFKEDGKEVDLVKISENLKAEPIIENGWIDRFSKYSNERDK